MTNQKQARGCIFQVFSVRGTCREQKENVYIRVAVSQSAVSRLQTRLQSETCGERPIAVRAFYQLATIAIANAVCDCQIRKPAKSLQTDCNRKRKRGPLDLSSNMGRGKLLALDIFTAFLTVFPLEG